MKRGKTRETFFLNEVLKLTIDRVILKSPYQFMRNYPPSISRVLPRSEYILRGHQSEYFG